MNKILINFIRHNLVTKKRIEGIFILNLPGRWRQIRVCLPYSLTTYNYCSKFSKKIYNVYRIFMITNIEFKILVMFKNFKLKPV